MAKTKKTSELWLWIVRGLALVGMGVMIYLAQLHYKGLIGEGSFCDLGEGLSCSEVNASIYSEVLGIPVAFGGLGYFAAVLGLSWLIKKRGEFYRSMVIITLLALPFSAYLTYTEIYLIKSICVFCELSKGLMLLVLAVCWWQAGKLKAGIESKQIVGALIVGAMLAVGTWFLQTKTGEEGNYPNLAACLTGKGMVMYGSARCSVCAKERKTFGESFELIEEIECHPREEGAQTELCLQKEVSKTPTFVLEEDGQEKWRLVGYQAPEKLAEMAGCGEAYQQDLELVGE